MSWISQFLESLFWLLPKRRLECQVHTKINHFRHMLLFEFNQGVKASEAPRLVYSLWAIGESTAQKWFYRFKNDCSLRLDLIKMFKCFNWRWSTSINSRMEQYDELFPINHRTKFEFHGFSYLKNRCMGTICFRRKQKKIACYQWFLFAWSS